jgi:hypothetical protein
MNMMKLISLLMAMVALPFAFAPVGASSAASDTPAALAKEGPMTCDIQITQVPGGIRLQPIALSDVNVSGTYQFAVSKSGGGNTSMTSQGGPFSAQAGRAVVLSDSAFDARGSLAATLTIYWQGGSLSCEKRYPSA